MYKKINIYVFYFIFYPPGDASLSEQHELLRSSGDRMKDLRVRVQELEAQLDMAIKKNAR